MDSNNRIQIYQIFTRTFANKNLTRKQNGAYSDNGAGKMNDINADVLKQIHDLGISYVWYTGVIRHASTTDYSRFGIPVQHPKVIKGKAGSPYAITDYYDIDPDIAEDVNSRMDEFTKLVDRTHQAGMNVIIDFVPNHVARQYHSYCKPNNVRDLGEDDDTTKHFSPQNNFYYCPNCHFEPSFDKGNYDEYPARCTGNDRFDNHPTISDWYETIKLNYGIDYCDAGGRSYHFDPIPSTWNKMTDILLFWAAKGIDGFRCDMAEMVPHEFWAYATNIVKKAFPHIIFIGEVYAPSQYRTYIQSGFDYLYDKVGMYDCLRDVVCHRRPASAITQEWQATDDIREHMLYFLENHDEQRIASDFFCQDAKKAIPALIVSALLRSNPLMIYAGQEFGERGMDEEGFSGKDGRSTIFDYWTTSEIYNGYFARKQLSQEQLQLETLYKQILHLAKAEKAITHGESFDLMYVNGQTEHFDPHLHFAFLRKWQNELLLVVANFSDDDTELSVRIPEHAFNFLSIPEGNLKGKDLLGKDTADYSWKKDQPLTLKVKGNIGAIIKFTIPMKDTDSLFNAHNKEEFPPAHTAEHLLNQLMVRMFGTERSNNAHIERKKSKISYVLDHKPTRKEENAIEKEMNRLIAEDMSVSYEVVDKAHLPSEIDASRLPNETSDAIRLVRIGDYDICPCIGKHVRSTAQIGTFHLLGTNWDETTHTFRIRFKVVQ